MYYAGITFTFFWLIIFVFLESYKRQALLFISVLIINLISLNNFANSGHIITVCTIIMLMVVIIAMLKIKEDILLKYMD